MRNIGDVDSPVQGLGQSYFMDMPILAVLGANNANGEPRLDRNYPGFNFNISDQRRAREFSPTSTGWPKPARCRSSSTSTSPTTTPAAPQATNARRGGRRR